MSAPALNPSRDTLLAIARGLPPAAQILAGICELLQDVNTDLDQIADEIRMDAALAGRVIRVSNSVVYGGRNTVSSVEEAVGRVGFSEVVRLVGSATVNRVVDRELRCYHIGLDELRESLLMHALGSEAIADAAGMNRNTAYVSGLLRGIGMMVLDRFAAEKIGGHQTYDPTEYETYRLWEARHFGIHATRVTTMALDDWRFPEEVVGAVDAHLEPPDSDEDVARLATAVNVAGAIATHFGHALHGEVPHWALTPVKLDRLNLTEERYLQIAEEVNQTFAQQRKALY